MFHSGHDCHAWPATAAPSPLWPPRLLKPKQHCPNASSLWNDALSPIIRRQDDSPAPEKICSPTTNQTLAHHPLTTRYNPQSISHM